MRSGLKVAIALLALMLAPSLASAGSAAAEAKSPACSPGRDFDGLLLCVPQDNARYQLTQDGVDWMAWQGDDPAGKQGFDRFMSVVAASILRAAQGAASSDAFATDVPVDESGLTQRFQFTQIQPDLLQGRSDKEDIGIDFILFRPSSGSERPHLLLCSGGKSLASPTHMCMSMREVDGHRVGIMITGTKLERSFRIAEDIITDLETFVVHQAP
jgi:hypothetical protein